MTLRPLVPDDWPQVRAIYEEGIATGNATFETAAPEWEEWDAARLPHGRWVAEEDGRVLGWIALTPYSRRAAYSGVAEIGVYVAAEARGRGVGTALLRGLIEDARRAGLWTLQAGVFPENRASLELLRRNGFREVGRRERIGRLHGAWRDVLLLELRL